MPIRPENRQYYGIQWRRFRLSMLEAAGNACQRCRKPHRLINVAHLSNDPTDREFLAVLRPSCHARNDTRQRIAMTRRTWAQHHGQLWVNEEIRLAPFPAWMWPAEMVQNEVF